MQICQATDLAKCQGVERIEYATEEDRLLDAMNQMQMTSMEIEDEGVSEPDSNGMDEDCDGDAELIEKPGKGKGYDSGSLPEAASVEAESAPAPKREKEEPVVDE